MCGQHSAVLPTPIQKTALCMFSFFKFFIHFSRGSAVSLANRRKRAHNVAVWVCDAVRCEMKCCIYRAYSTCMLYYK